MLYLSFLLITMSCPSMAWTYSLLPRRVRTDNYLGCQHIHHLGCAQYPGYWVRKWVPLASSLLISHLSLLAYSLIHTQTSPPGKSYDHIQWDCCSGKKPLDYIDHRLIQGWIEKIKIDPYLELSIDSYLIIYYIKIIISFYLSPTLVRIE